jgi:hypothetical protein
MVASRPLRSAHCTSRIAVFFTRSLLFEAPL